jgi:hypothetical protein
MPLLINFVEASCFALAHCVCSRGTFSVKNIIILLMIRNHNTEHISIVEINVFVLLKR